MRKRGPGRWLLVLGFIAASFSYGGWMLMATVLDPSATTAVARRVIATPVVQDNLAKQIRTQVDSELRDAHADPQVQRAVDAAIRDPRVAAAFANAVGDVQRALLSNSPQTITINSRALTSALHDALERIDPQLAAQVAKQPPVSATIDASKAPHLRSIHNAADLVAVLGAIVALALIGTALKLNHSRKAIARFGRRVAYLSITPMLAFVVLPAVVPSHGAADVIRVAMEEYAGRVVPSALAFLGLGVMIVIASLFMRRPNLAAAPAVESKAFTPAPALRSPLDPLASAAAAPPRLGETLRL
jgi:hypothetical protein